MAGLYAPLPTLRRRPRGRLRTDRGRRGLLLLHRSGLSPHTPCQSPGALARVTARRIAQPPKVTFVTRLRSHQLPSETARQLPDLSTIIRVEPSSTDNSRLQGALPFVDQDLAGEDGRAAPVAFLEDLVEVTTGTGVERFEAPIVEDEELDAGETAEDAGIATVTAGERKLGEELGNPLIENRAVVAAGLLTPGTSKPRFAHAG